MTERDAEFSSAYPIEVLGTARNAAQDRLSLIIPLDGTIGEHLVPSHLVKRGGLRSSSTNLIEFVNQLRSHL